MVLQPSEARAYYDRFGRKQDSQGFYEDAAIDALIAHGEFREAGRVFEFGCGTGRLASTLLAKHLSASAAYFGCDLSTTMVSLAARRLKGYGERARVVQSDGTMQFPVPEHSVDRVVSTYVLDLLSEADARAFFLETHRVLKQNGKVCLVSLTNGTTFLSRTVSSVWSSIFRLEASLVGGCRPIQVSRYLEPNLWQIEYHQITVAFGVPSEVLVARARGRL